MGFNPAKPHPIPDLTQEELSVLLDLVTETLQPTLPMRIEDKAALNALYRKLYQIVAPHGRHPNGQPK